MDISVAQWASLLTAGAQVGRLIYDIWAVWPPRFWPFVTQHWRDIFIVLLLVSLFLCLGRPFFVGPTPNELLTAQAWDALDSKNLELALYWAEECINKYLGDANSQQARLQNDHVPSPLTGRVSKSDFKIITARGELNDVATCYYIKGLVLEQKGELQRAQEAYREAQKLSYGRCVVDPNPKAPPALWSPAEASTGALDRLQNQVPGTALDKPRKK